MLNRGNSSAVTLRKPLPVNDVTFASTIVSQSDTLAASAGAAGTKGTLMCTFAPIASAQGDLVGNFNDKSLVITSTALTTEVPFEVVMARASADQNSNTVGEGAPDYKAYLSPGEFYVIYETGRIFYSKADASTAVTAAYKYRGGATGPLIAGDVEIGAVEIKNSTTDDRAVVSTAGADAESNTANKFNVVAWLKGFNGTTWDRLRTAVTTVSATFTGFLNSLPWAIYNATPTPRTEGQGGPLQTDVDGNLRVNAGAMTDDAAFTPATSKVTPGGFLADEAATDSVDEGDVGIARMTLDRKQIMANQVVDDTAFTPATSYVGVMGAQADETATDSVDEGDAGALRMTLDRRLYTMPWAIYNATPTPRTEGQGGPLQTDELGNVKATLRSYDSATSANKGFLIRDVSDQYVSETLIDTTNVGAATNYYPSTAGISMDGYKNLTIQAQISGGVTATIEATNDDAASPDWIDITDSLYNWTTAGTRYSASWVDTNFLFDLTNCNWKNVRIKSITSDATNSIQYNIRKTY